VTPDDLVERVALAIHDGLGGDGWAYSNYGYDETKHCAEKLAAAARAAIAIALEEAARVIENECHDDMTRAEEAAAIRAMIKD